MTVTDKLPRYIFILIIAGLSVLLLREWTSFSEEFDASRKQAIYTDNATNEISNSIASNSESTINANSDDDLLPDVSDASNNVDSEVNDRVVNNVVNTSSQTSSTIDVETDTLKVTISKRGGEIIQVAMKKHLSELDPNSAPLNLLEKNAYRHYAAQSGLLGPSGTNAKSAVAVFSTTQSYYQLEESEDRLRVPMTFVSNGVELTKTFIFETGSYYFDVEYDIVNHSGDTWTGQFYAQILRDSTDDPGTDDAPFGMQSYLGTATTNEETPYEKLDFEEIAENKYRETLQGGWVAMIQHYFVSAWVPDQQGTYTYFTKKSSTGLNIIGFYSTPITIEDGESSTISSIFYAGPKDQYTFAKLAKHFDLTIDYGWLWWLSMPLYALLYFFYHGELHVFGNVFNIFPGFQNWGVAIILLTVVVKALFFKLSATSYRSMANMRRVQPQLLAIREQHGDDRQAQSKAMMELYQKEKINPLGGCLPILVQMPVFLALYWALIESVELRHAQFLWLNDLSVMDPYFILPILMGATMWFQQRLNPAPPDPMQAKIMQWMPIVFTFFFLWFPSGLVVYWVSNNLLSILQQYVITKSIERDGLK